MDIKKTIEHQRADCLVDDLPQVFLHINDWVGLKMMPLQEYFNQNLGPAPKDFDKQAYKVLDGTVPNWREKSE